MGELILEKLYNIRDVVRIMSEKRNCPNCNGYGEIMYREKLIDSDGSEDIGATPEVMVCPTCNGEGKVVPFGKPRRLIEEEKVKLIIKLKKEGKI